MYPLVNITLKLAQLMITVKHREFYKIVSTRNKCEVLKILMFNVLYILIHSKLLVKQHNAKL
jgi:hypothetical protein